MRKAYHHFDRSRRRNRRGSYESARIRNRRAIADGIYAVGWARLDITADRHQPAEAMRRDQVAAAMPPGRKAKNAGGEG